MRREQVVILQYIVLADGMRAQRFQSRYACYLFHWQSLRTYEDGHSGLRCYVYLAME